MTEQDLIRKFIDQVRWLHEPEFGDFKRKVGLYIQRLQESGPAMQKGAAGKILSQMKLDVVYSPNGDIESTRKHVLELAQKALVSVQH